MLEFLDLNTIYLVKVGEVVGAAGTEGSSRTANKKMYNGKVTRIIHQIVMLLSLSNSSSIID